ncbi:hypothetical protein VF21_02575 [Pseudogymnoascus sp. 05NY08]|nr:hypothetical protein VF21_02575 [Pseudogymnoascus sp. 05NY08]
MAESPLFDRCLLYGHYFFISAAFSPASSIMGAMLILVRGARKVSEAFDGITDLFRKLGNFALRLDSYKGVPLSEGMKAIIVNVLVNFLRVCGASQKCLSSGSLRARLSKWAKNIFVEDTTIISLLSEPEELKSQEHLMRDGRKSDREKLERVKASLNPVSASGQVFSSINENRIPGSGSWIEDRIRTWWQGPQPLIWLHGGPGVGKSHLASKIITDLSKTESPTITPPMVASFFCKNNDVDLRSLNKALRTLAWRIATQRPSFATHAEEFSLKEDPENSYIAWRKLLVEYFATAPLDATACFVSDGIDEVEPDQQDILFSLLKRTFEDDDATQRPPLRVVLLSRDSIRPMIDEHSLSWIPEIEVGNEQNKDDLHYYVSQKLQKTQLFRGSPDFQDEIISEISREAEGLWEWANFVIKSVLRCRTKKQIRKAVKAMPRGISAMLRQELQRLSRELSISDTSDEDEGSAAETTAAQIEQLNILLSFVTLAVKPLTVWQLDIMLEIVLKEEVLNLEDDIRTIDSSLFSTTPNENKDTRDHSDVVTLRHGSFYEFFKASEKTGPIHVNTHQTEAGFV